MKGEECFPDTEVDMERNFSVSEIPKSVCTAGTCAAVAATAAALMIFTGETVCNVSVRLPKGKIFIVDIKEPSFSVHGVRCCVRTGGDDIGLTDETLIYADVNLDDSDEIHISGGKGRAREKHKGCVTGETFVNPATRRMITENIRKICNEYGYNGGVNIVISVPFNTQPEAEGEISAVESEVIIEPVSEKTLIDCIKVEMLAIKERGYNRLLVFTDADSENFIGNTLGMLAENRLRCGNYLAEVLDFAAELYYNEILVAGHINNMVKLAGGMTNSFLQTEDLGMEIFGCYAGLYGAGSDVIAEILSAENVENVLYILKREKLQKIVMQKINERALYYINKRVDNKINVKLVFYSNRYGILN